MPQVGELPFLCKNTLKTYKKMYKGKINYKKAMDAEK